MNKFYDIECNRILTETQLRIEYEEFKFDIEESSGATTYDEYITNATGKNGFLMKVKEVGLKGSIMIVTLMYDDEYYQVGTCTDIDVVNRFGERSIYFVDNGLGEEWEIDCKDVLKIERNRGM